MYVCMYVCMYVLEWTCAFNAQELVRQFVWKSMRCVVGRMFVNWFVMCFVLRFVMCLVMRWRLRQIGSDSISSNICISIDLMSYSASEIEVLSEKCRTVIDLATSGPQKPLRSWRKLDNGLLRPNWWIWYWLSEVQLERNWRFWKKVWNIDQVGPLGSSPANAISF